VASIDEVRAGISLANDKANESLGSLQQAHAALEEAQGALLHATDGSGQADVSEATGLLAQAVSNISDVLQQVNAAIQASDDISARL
jgi:methyl-accepting chemotaxis protein